MRNGESGILGVDVDGGGVEGDGGAALGQEEARDAADFDSKPGGERQLYPGCVLAQCKGVALAADREFGATAAPQAQGEGDLHRAGFLVDRVGRALDGAPAKSPVTPQGNAIPTLHPPPASPRLAHAKSS